MRGYFGYIRVSTIKQSDGASLQEQRASIEAYAAKHGLPIAGWYEELQTAAKRGRHSFNAMLAKLEAGKATGVIIHKVDRSARNLGDWARLGDLIDCGIDVRFAHESLDLKTRGGRLAADIQAVVASDFIRNHREEVKKGIYGSLKLGRYPFNAPRGYLNCGRRATKQVDPVLGPIVKAAFELYASGNYTLQTLSQELHERGLRGSTGRPLSFNAMSVLLHNPFYMGIVRNPRTGEAYDGLHEALVSRTTFDRVQAVLKGRVWARPVRHEFAYRRLIRCTSCNLRLVGERRKGHVYYRCHSRTCRGTSLREEDIEQRFREILIGVQLSEEELRDLGETLERTDSDRAAQRRGRDGELRRLLGTSEDRLRRLTDGYLDGTIDKEVYASRQFSLIAEQRDLKDRLAKPTKHGLPAETLIEKLGRENMAYTLFAEAFPAEKRDIVKSVTSDVSVSGKSLDFRLREVPQAILNWRGLLCGALTPGTPRTLDIEKLVELLVRGASGVPFNDAIGVP